MTAETGDMDIDHPKRISGLVSAICGELARDDLPISFHDDMPSAVPLLGVAVETLEGRHDEETVVVRNRHLLEGGGRTELVVQHSTSDVQTREVVMAWLEPALDQMRGERDIRRSGGDPLHPHATDLVAHPLVASMMVWLDLHSGSLQVQRSGSGRDAGVFQRQGSISLGRVALQTVRTRRGDDTVTCELDLGGGGRIHARELSVVSEAARLRIADLGEDLAELSLSGIALPPAAVVSALAGRPLGQVVSHPGTAAASELPIRRAVALGDAFGGTRLSIEVEGAPVPLVPTTV